MVDTFEQIHSRFHTSQKSSSGTKINATWVLCEKDAVTFETNCPNVVGSFRNFRGAVLERLFSLSLHHLVFCCCLGTSNMTSTWTHAVFYFVSISSNCILIFVGVQKLPFLFSSSCIGCLAMFISKRYVSYVEVLWFIYRASPWPSKSPIGSFHWSIYSIWSLNPPSGAILNWSTACRLAVSANKSLWSHISVVLWTPKICLPKGIFNIFLQKAQGSCNAGIQFTYKM